MRYVGGSVGQIVVQLYLDLGGEVGLEIYVFGRYQSVGGGWGY